MYLLAKFSDRRSYRNGDINSYVITLEKAELTASIRCVAKFSKQGIPIYNSEVQDTAVEKQEKEEHRQFAKRFAFYANSINSLSQ